MLGYVCAGCASQLAASVCESGSVAMPNGEILCQVCKTGVHSITLLRRRLDDNLFERLMHIREAAKTARAVSDAAGSVLENIAELAY